jgi:putative sterol carrier protein
MRSEGPDLVKRIKVRRRLGERSAAAWCGAAAGCSRPSGAYAHLRAGKQAHRHRTALAAAAAACAGWRSDGGATCPGGRGFAPHLPPAAREPHRQPRPLSLLPCPPFAKGLVVFDIDGEKWALDLRTGEGSLVKGAPSDKPDLTLTMTDTNFAQLVMGKLNPQQARPQAGEIVAAQFARSRRGGCAISARPQRPLKPIPAPSGHASLQAFLLRKLKINGSMAMALKLQPILDAAAPKAKL